MRTALLVAATTAAAVVLTAPAASAATAYHVDCAASTGGNGGSTSPWNSLAQVNATTFAPGDQILFKRGSTCTGTLTGAGSGTAAAPIRVGAYGTGTARPVINGAGAMFAVHLKDVSYWTLNDLRVTNTSATRAERNGVRVETSSAAAKAGIVIDGLEVDNVAGWGDKTGTNAPWFSRSSGIMVLGAASAGPINGITIVNNYVHDTGGGGIKISNKPSAYHTAVRIADNRIISVGGDGIVVHGSDGPLVERNRADNLGGGAYPFVAGNFAGMWPINSRNPVFQFNEVTRSYPSIFDSTAWDCDGGIVGTCTYQYNFSAGNAGGFHLGCQTCTSFPNYKAKEIIRYNVSQDDCRAKWVSGSNGPVEMYNNTFFCASNPIDFTLPNGTGATTSIRNNIFVAAHGSFPTGTGVTYDNNLYWGGVTPASGDTNAVTGDPALAYPGGSGTGFNSVDGYKLRTGSPALGAGVAITGAGGRDYFGAAVPKADGSVNIGADNGSGVGAYTYPNLKAAFNNTGISKDVNPAIGGFSLSGRSYSAEALAGAGFTAGPVTVNGVTFQWAQQYYGFPDNVKAAGQKISLSGSGTSIAFLGAGGYDNQSGTGTVTYTDGTTSTYSLSLTNWWASAPIAGNQVAAALTYHNKPPTTYNDPSTGRDQQDVRLFQTSVPITAGKTVASITLPNVGGPLAGPGLHVFAMTIV